MHPNPSFRHNDHALFETLIHEIGFGMIFATTPDGPRVAHTPLLSTGNGTVQFHLARGNALTRHLAGVEALAVINGPDGYISPRWYADPQQVPTWNYIALEVEGPVRAMDNDGLLALLTRLSERHESRIAHGERWTMDKVPPAQLRALMGAITGFEMEIRDWRPTIKLSQNKPEAERLRVTDALDAEGSSAIAHLMRQFGEAA